MMNFTELNTPANLVESLARMRITTPTPIQEQAIPLGLGGHDVLGSAQTGTGKTIAYLIPILAKLEENPDQTALILTPTRELATQVRDTLLQILGRKSTFGLALLIGGESFTKQLLQLRNRPQIYIGTPGRIIDHLNRNTLRLNTCGFLVLDETDRMLDMGFNEQLQELCRYVPEERQTFMFSATIPDSIMKLAGKYLNDPKRVSIGSTTLPIDKVQQDVRFSPEKNKFEVLTDELDARTGSIIVFVKTKRGADELVYKLQNKNYQAAAIHGDLRQQKRERVIREFRNKRHRIMVATDIAARGLDIPHIEHVVNYDLPQCPEDFIHRIGRTGRADAVGQALTMISPKDGFLWSQIYKMMHPGKPCDMPEGYSAENPKGRNRKRSGGSSAPRSGGFFKPRQEGRDKPRSHGRDRGDRQDRPAQSSPYGERPQRDSRPSKPGYAKSTNRWNDDKELEFVPHGQDGAARGDKPRSDRPFKRREGSSLSDYAPRDRNAPRGEYAPRDRNAAPRGEYAPRDRNAAPRGEYAPRDRNAAPRGEYAPRDRNAAPRGEYAPRDRNAAPRGEYAPRDRNAAPRGEYAPRDRNAAPRGEYAPRDRDSGFGDRPRHGGGFKKDRPASDMQDRSGDRQGFGSSNGFAKRKPGPGGKPSGARPGGFGQNSSHRKGTSSGTFSGGNAPAFKGRKVKSSVAKRV